MPGWTSWASVLYRCGYWCTFGVVIALLAPGQGAQSPGMLTPWLALAGAQARVATWSTATGLDLARLGTTADAEEIKDTAVTQPLVVALSLLAAEELARRVDLPADAPVTGHSVGEPHRSGGSWGTHC